MAVTLKQVTKCYGKQKALDGLNITLSKGEICGFLGPNGAGKSTTMKIITGFLTDFEGEVYINDVDIRKDPLRAKKLIGYLPEHNPLYPDMYIREYLLHVARLYRLPEPRLRVDEIVELTGLSPEIHKKIGELSKGYRQRVGLAQALVHDPEVLILDEPMTGLDPNQLEEIRHLIVRAGKNKTVLLSTHIMQEVEAICDRVVILNQGAVVTDKPIGEIRALVSGSLNLLVQFTSDCETEWLNEFAGFEKRIDLGENRWQLVCPKGVDPRVDFFYAAAQHHCPIVELKAEEHRLEEVFRQMTQ